jgi:hypothetical protein
MLATLTIAGSTDNWTGKLDITNNALVLQTSGPADKSAKIPALRNQIASGENSGVDGPWTGVGITSSSIATDPNTSFALADNADLHYTSFRGQAVNDASLILAQAVIGDANLDGLVNAFDLNLLATHWLQPAGALWSAGDFTRDGKVDAFDLNALASHWQFVSGNLAATLSQFPQFSADAAPVPEPATVSLLTIAGLALLARRAGRPSS